MPVLTDLQVALEAELVLRGQGIDPAQARPAIVAAAQEVLDEARALLAPAALYAVLPVREEACNCMFLLGAVAAFEGPLVVRALAGATQVALAVCTIGPALEERVTALFAAGDPLRAMMLDGAGVAAVGGVSQTIGERICDEAAARGLTTGMRASPGQEGWPIEQQRVLFSLLPADRIGVRLTESCLMLPRKSVSFVVGLGAEMRADRVACDYCSKRERCRWRSPR
jgi:hypothetical protein